MPSHKIRRFRFVTCQVWFPAQREENVDHQFYTRIQMAFYYTYCQLGVRFGEHRRLHWGSLRVAARGVPILPLFEVYTGLRALLSDRDRYVREWVRIFYATLFIDEDRQFIEFMFQGRHCTLTRQMLAELLGVPHTDEPHSLHHLTYGDVDPPCRPHQSYPPPDEEASRLFVQPFLPGISRVPDRLTPLAKTVHLTLRRSLLYRLGYNEGTTALQ